MSTSVRDVLAVLDRIAAPERAASWDPVGLQVGDPAARVDRVAVCHEVTEAVVDRLETEPVDLLVTYHPLVFRSTTRFVAGRSAPGRAFRLARRGVAVAVVHTSFDVAPGGAADALADVLGLDRPRGFGPLWGPETVRVVTFVPSEAVESVAAAMASVGAGSVGRYSGCSFRSEGIGAFTASEGSRPAAGEAGSANREPEVRLEMSAPASITEAVVAELVASHPYEEPVYDVLDRRGDAGFVGRIGGAKGTLGDLAGLVESSLGGVVRVAGDEGAAVRSVAVVPGSGSSLLTSAGRAGADVVVTGDVRHHDARAALDRGLSVIDPGHAATERPGVRRLYAAVAAQVADVVDLTEDPDPWRPV